MNESIRKYIYLFVTICILIVVAKLFISILPLLLIAAIVIYAVSKIKKMINDKSETNKHNMNSNTTYNKETYESADDDYSNGQVIDVDYEDVSKNK